MAKLRLTPIERALLRLPCDHRDIIDGEGREVGSELVRLGYIFVMFPATKDHPGAWIDHTALGAREKMRVLRKIEQAGGPDNVENPPW